MKALEDSNYSSAGEIQAIIGSVILGISNDMCERCCHSGDEFNEGSRLDNVVANINDITAMAQALDNICNCECVDYLLVDKSIAWISEDIISMLNIYSNVKWKIK